MNKLNKGDVKLVCGVPGVGKTTAFHNLITKALKSKGKLYKVGLILFHMYPDLDLVILGHYNGSTFQGTDRMSMAASRDFEKFFRTIKPGMKVFGEGDRLNNSNFINWAMWYGELEMICCETDRDTLKKRREKRNTNQDPSFLKRVQTKVEKHNYHKRFDSKGLYQYLKQCAE